MPAGAGPLCTANCKRMSTNPACADTMCPTHCAVLGGCKVNPHKKARELHLASNLPPAPTPSSMLNVLPPTGTLRPDAASSSSWPSHTPAARPASHNDSAFGWMNSYSATQDVGGSIGGAFDDLDSTPSLGDYSSVSSLGLSFATSATTSSSTGSTLVPLTYPFTSNSGPIPSLPLPPPSSTLSSLEPMEARPGTPPPPLPSQPRTRLPAASLPKPATKPLRLTSQMNSDWMEANGVSSTAPIHLRRAAANHAFVDDRLIKRFHLVAFITPGKPPYAQVIDDCASWPVWQVSAAGDDVAQLVEGLTENAKLDVYDPDRRLWFAIKLNTPHRLTTGCTIFLRRRYPDWDDVQLEETIAQYLRSLVAHMRYNLPAERKAVRAAYKQIPTPATRTAPILSPSPSLSPSPVLPAAPSPVISFSSLTMDDDDLALAPLQPAKRRFDYLADVESDERVVRPRLTIATDVTSFPSAASTPALSATTSTPSSSSAPSSGPSTPSFDLVALPATSSVPKGFGDMYVVDVVAGFHAIDVQEKSGVDIMARFEAAFPGRRYVQVTYNDNRCKWKDGPIALRQAGIDAGRTPAGLWKVYTRQVAAASRTRTG
ncbi:hypothetical protein C8F01DRAFT_1254137 [Mycena amicta]|nr:hypothetical protein C8F01DRAFT_1254137 [Mycena amicta]